MAANKAGIHQSSEGVIDLKWKLKGAEKFELVAASPDAPEDYQTRYTGKDRSSVLTGMREGTYSYKVRAMDEDGNPGPWSEPLLVEVKYMSASRVRLLMILGGLVVLLTVIAILHGHFSHRRKEAEA